MKTLLIIDSQDRWIIEGWSENQTDLEVRSPQNYLSDAVADSSRSVRFCNLCRSYAYQSTGYYVSLLAEARGHRIQPDVMTIGDISLSRSVRFASPALEKLIERSLTPLGSKEFTLSIYFGKNLAKRYEQLARAIHQQFNAPLLRCRFTHRKKWKIANLWAVSTSDIPRNHREFVREAAREFFSRPVSRKLNRTVAKYDLAVLHDPAEGELAPSCEKALQRLIRAGESEGVRTELLTAADAGRLFEFDALFIRETTSVEHHTYRLARRAQAAGMPVIDDPLSILRCTNKVFLAQILNRAKLLTPVTTIVHKNHQTYQPQVFPVVVKQPDSAFSLGVMKAENQAELELQMESVFEHSELLIVQQFMPTDYDWRIGVLDGCPLFACKYHMARGHWQIAKHGKNGEKPKFGKCETHPIELAPKKCVAMARKAASLIGDGFYGVDLKQVGDNFYVIEINDNPNLDAGIEDKIMGAELYRRIIRTLVRRLETR
ncbi:MAG: RimK family protein [Planctomycetota bacterium]